MDSERRDRRVMRTQRLLQLLSLGMALAVAVSAWAIATLEGPMQFMLPLFTVLATLALPFVALGLASNREAAESRIRRAIKVALQDEPERMPAQQRPTLPASCSRLPP